MNKVVKAVPHYDELEFLKDYYSYVGQEWAKVQDKADELYVKKEQIREIIEYKEKERATEGASE